MGRGNALAFFSNGREQIDFVGGAGRTTAAVLHEGHGINGGRTAV